MYSENPKTDQLHCISELSKAGFSQKEMTCGHSQDVNSPNLLVTLYRPVICQSSRSLCH